MSKRILALALFAVMVLSLVPLAQAAPETVNVVYAMGITNQVRGTSQTSSNPLVVNGYTYPNYVSGSVTGDVDKTSSFTYDWNVLSLSNSHSDLFKRAQSYSTTDVARYDVWVKIPVAFKASADTSFTFGSYSFLVSALDAAIASETNYLAPSTSYDATVAEAKKFLNFSEITVNGSTLSSDYLRVSYLNYEAVGTTQHCLYYYLKVGEFDATDVASASADYNIVHRTTSGTNNTKVRVNYTNSGESDKPIKPLYLKPVRKGTEGVYSIYVVNGVVFIDYAQDIAKTTYDNTGAADTGSGNWYAAIPVGFKFYEDAAATVRIPSYGKYAYIVPSTNTDDTPVSADRNRFFVSSTNASDTYSPYQITYIGYTDSTVNNREGAPYSIPAASTKSDAGRITNGDDKVLGVWLPNDYVKGTNTVRTESTNKTMKVAIEDENYRYRTGDIKVVFRPLARNLITTAVIVERYLTIAVGEKVTLTIESASATTFDNIKLSEVSSTKSHVYIDGMDVTGISVGTSQIQVSASSKVIDQITVNVVATKETAAAEVVVTNQWRVIARKLNIRTGPGTSYGKAGTLAMNQVVAGTDTGTGWVEIGAGQYVSKQYVVPVTGSATGIGTYTISASSLNVRSGPGSSYAKTGSVTRGTIVEVIAIQNGWAQLASGGWVSTTYLK